MNPPRSRLVTLSLRLCRALAGALPFEFQNAYGEQLEQATTDAVEPVWRHQGARGLLRLMVDFAVRIPAEHLAELRQDVRYGLRTLAASPGFTAVALVSLSLAIAVATSSYSDMNGVILRDVARVARPGELITLESPSSYPAYLRYRERRDLFASTLAYIAPVPFGVTVEGHTERTWGQLVTPSYFPALGVRPIMGRVFGEEPEQPGQAPRVVISHRFWQNRLGSDPLAIGKALRINGRPAEIIGIAPPDFQGASPMLFTADLWIPIWVEAALAPELSADTLERRDRRMFQVVGRLKPGVTPARAEAELDTVARQLDQSFGEEDKRQKGRRVTVLPGGKVLPIPKRSLPLMTGFFVVLGGTILLIACANTANMMLARAGERRKEIAVRLALGAGRARLIRQLLTESMLLAAAAGFLGFLLTMWLMHLSSEVKIPYPMPVRFDVEPDGRVLLFAIALTAFTGLAFGLAPAFEATRTDLTPALKEGGNVRLRRYRRLSLRNLLVVTQVAASLMLLLLTAIMVLGYHRTLEIQVSFKPANLHLISLDPVRDGYSGAQAAAFCEKLLDRVKGLPAVTAASYTETVPMSLSGSGSVTFSTIGPGVVGARAVRSAHRFVVGRDYFETIGLPILHGRGFRKEDEAEDAMAVIVSEQLGREFWSGAEALGRRIEIGDGEAAPFKVGAAFDDNPGRLGQGRHVFEVVGVAKNEKENLVKKTTESRPVIYFPLRPADFGRPSVRGITLLVRGAPGSDVIGAVRREITTTDANVTPFNTRGMQDHIEETVFPYRMSMWFYAIMGAFGLVLAVVGLAGVTAYSVTRRSREIGIRMALGARPGNVLGLVMGEGLVLILAGAVLGLAGAWAGVRMLWGMLSTAARVTGSTASDPVILLGVPALVIGLALAACYLPARRSLRIDPAVTLRQE